MGTGARTHPSSDADRRRWQAVAVGLVAAFMSLLDVSIVNVAVPSIRAALRADPSQVQWILSGYALTFGLVLVPAGRFGDVRGRRTAFVLGLAGFTLASAAAGLAQSSVWLITARLVQGAAAGVMNPQVAGLIQEMFPVPERGRPFGLLGTVIGVSTAVGPLLGGLLLHFGGAPHGWRWVFFVNAPVGIVAIWFALRLLPGAREPARRQSLDPVGVLLLGCGVLLLLLPLLQERPWSGPAKWLFLPASAALLAGFAWWERRRCRDPVFSLVLFRQRCYALGSVIALFYFAGFTAIFFTYTIFLQEGLHHSPLRAGLAITPFALGSAVAAGVGGRIVHRLGRPLVAVGLGVVALALVGVVVALHAVPAQWAPVAAAGPLLLVGLGSGLVITPNQTLTLAEVPVDLAGAAAGMLQTAQRIGSALGIAAIGSAFFRTLTASDTDWFQALRVALLVAVALVLVALVAAVADLRLGRSGPGRGNRPTNPPPRSPGSPPRDGER